jgi:hypothetical protein
VAVLYVDCAELYHHISAGHLRPAYCYSAQPGNVERCQLREIGLPMRYLLNTDAVSLCSVTDETWHASPNAPRLTTRTFQTDSRDAVSITFYDTTIQFSSTKLSVEPPVTRRCVRPLTLPAHSHSDSSE